MRNSELIACGYLYSSNAGTFREWGYGEVLRTTTGRVIFEVKDSQGRTVKSLNCSDREGEICCKLVWLYERDIRRAADILIEYEESQIAKLQFQIENHKRLITFMKSV